VAEDGEMGLLYTLFARSSDLVVGAIPIFQTVSMGSWVNKGCRAGRDGQRARDISGGVLRGSGPVSVLAALLVPGAGERGDAALLLFALLLHLLRDAVLFFESSARYLCVRAGLLSEEAAEALNPVSDL
jgi:hypothetical protein